MQREGLKANIISTTYTTSFENPPQIPLEHHSSINNIRPPPKTWPTCPTFLAHTFLDPCSNSSPVNQTTFCQYRVSLFLRPVHDYRILFECLSCHCYQSKRNNAGKNSMFSITILETVSGCLELNFPNFLGLLCIFSVSSTKHMQVNIETWCSTEFNTKHIAR